MALGVTEQDKRSSAQRMRRNSSGNAYDSAFPLGSFGGDALSGGTDALGYTITGLSSGETITITTDGTENFGTKITSTPVIWDMGADFRQFDAALTGHADATNGDLIKDSGIVTNAVGEINTARGNRHPEIDRHYVGLATTSVKLPYNDLLRVNSTSRKHYSCFRMRLPVDVRSVRTIPITSIAGTFVQGDLGELGEAATATISGTDYAANVIHVFDTKMVISVPGFSILSTTGQIDVTGLDSGATATLDTTLTGYVGAPAAKFYRINQEANDGVLAILQISTEQFWIESNLSGEDEIKQDRNTYALDFSQSVSDGQWFFVEMTQDWSYGAALTATARIIGDKGQEFTEIPPQDGSGNWLDIPVRILIMGLDSSVDHKLNVDFGEIMVDETPQRVAIGDNSDYDLCTAVEVQRVKSWSSTEIKAEVYKGAFGSLSDKYIFIFDESNSPTLVGQIA